MVAAGVSAGAGAGACVVSVVAGVFGASLLLLQPEALQKMVNAAQPKRAIWSLFMVRNNEGPKVIQKAGERRVWLLNNALLTGWSRSQ